MSCEWPAVLLGDVVGISSGGTPSKQNPDYWDGGIPWASAKDMKVLRLRSTEDSLTPAGARGGSRVAPAGSVLVLVRGMTLHSDVPIVQPQIDMAFNQDVKALVAGDRIDADFLLYALLAAKPRLLSSVDSSSHGTGRLNTDALRALQLLLPTLEEQRRIAAVLGCLDDKLELNREMSQTLDVILLGEFESRFSRFEGLPDIPVGWAIESVGSVLEVRGGTTPSTKNPDYWSGGVYGFCTPKDMSQLRVPLISTTDRCVTEEGLKKTGSGLLPVGTVLLSSRAPIGYVAVALQPVAVNQGIIAMVCSGRVSSSYAMCWTRLHQDEILARANGSTFLEISKGNFKTIPMLVPDDEAAGRFDSIADPLLKRMAVCEQQAHTLEELRDTLLPRLLSGELRIPDAEKVVEEVI